MTLSSVLRRGLAAPKMPPSQPTLRFVPYWSALGGAMVVHWAIKEARRISEEIEQAGRVKAKITDAENRPTLRRDPTTGEYRL